MDKIYRLIWNETLGAWTAVCETAKGRGKRTSGRVAALTLILAISAAALAAPPNPPAPTQLPTGAKVVAGQAAIAQSAALMSITQSTPRAAIDWQTFNVGAQAQVNFAQPSAGSVTLNRVLDANPSQIFGRISANGQVFLTNPSGVYFAPSASVDVGGLVATTHTIGNADFMAGNDRFTRNGATGSVVNDGSLRASLGGYIALLAPEVRNNGVIVARLGTVALAAGEAYTLQFDANTTLANIQVSPASVNVLVENGNAVHAPGGLIILSAQAANQLQGSIVRNSGALEASGLSASGGRIFLNAGAGGQTLVSGSLDVSATSGKGGRIEVTGERVLIDEGAYLTASGKTGGGEVLVGGSWQNSEPTVRQAISTTVAPGAQLQANATDSGKGGTVVAWSDIRNSNSVTRAYGRFEAKGGPNGGDGGRIETSGHYLDTEGVSGNASAPSGKPGEWLFDPFNVTIQNTGTQSGGNFSSGTWTPSGTSTILTANINSLLNADTNVTISTGIDSTGSSGDITFSSAPTIAKTVGSSDVTLRLEANRNITLTGTIYSGSSSTDDSSKGKLNLFLNANRSDAADGSGGVKLSSATIRTQGGYFKVYGGSAGDTYVKGNTALFSPTNWAPGFYMSTGNVYTSGGAIEIMAQSGDTQPQNTTGAIHLESGTLSSSGGRIWLRGLGSSSTYYNGIYMYPYSSSNNLAISSGAGSIFLDGQAQRYNTNAAIELSSASGYTVNINATTGGKVRANLYFKKLTHLSQTI